MKRLESSFVIKVLKKSELARKLARASPNKDFRFFGFEENQDSLHEKWYVLHIAEISIKEMNKYREIFKSYFECVGDMHNKGSIKQIILNHYCRFLDKMKILTENPRNGRVIFVKTNPKDIEGFLGEIYGAVGENTKESEILRVYKYKSNITTSLNYVIYKSDQIIN